MRLGRRHASSQRNLTFDLTSMIDVVFLLLLFFMLNVRFRNTERDLNPAVQDPRQSSAQAARDLEPILIAFARTPDTRQIAYVLGGRQITDTDELKRILRQFPNTADGAFVKVNDEIPFAMVAAALQACHDAGFTSVTYLPASETPL